MKRILKPVLFLLVAGIMVACAKQEPIKVEASIKDSGPKTVRTVVNSPGVIEINDETAADTGTAGTGTVETGTAETSAGENSEEENGAAETDSAQTDADNTSVSSGSQIGLNSSWKYAEYSKINSGKATLYKPAGNGNGITVCVNAGHGTSGGASVKTQCHPDGSAKVTGGTTSAGSTTAVAVSGGTTFTDGTSEAKVTLACALKLKDKLLAKGYNVLMIRESDDVQLDNIARTVIANNMASCHIALHWDSTESDKGAYYCSVPNNPSYRSMEPVASHWQQHQALGNALVNGLRAGGVKIWKDGWMDMDLTQTSYSTVPSVDIELGDRVSDHSDATLNKICDGLMIGINSYFGK